MGVSDWPKPTYRTTVTPLINDRGRLESGCKSDTRIRRSSHGGRVPTYVHRHSPIHSSPILQVSQTAVQTRPSFGRVAAVRGLQDTSPWNWDFSGHCPELPDLHLQLLPAESSGHSGPTTSGELRQDADGGSDKKGTAGKLGAIFP